MKDSRIEWCDHTINFWWGCEKVSPACVNCYAERTDARFHPAIVHGANLGVGEHWGSHAPRLLRVSAAQGEAMRYERRAAALGRRFRVFTNSMSDFFEDRPDLDQARAEALMTIRCTPNLDWMVLTKRPERIAEHLGCALGLWRAEPSTLASRSIIEWLERWIGGDAPANVWLGTTVEDQVRADQRIPALLAVPAAVRFLSCEPLLGRVSFRWARWSPTSRHVTGASFKGENHLDGLRALDWVICGGESGANARPMHPSWAREMRDQCAAAGVPFFFKQWGAGVLFEQGPSQGDLPGAVKVRTISKKAAGRLLDGQEHNAFPMVRP